MSFTVIDYRAVEWYCRQYKLRPALSIFPMVRFSDGTEMDRMDLWEQYQEWKGSERARIKREKQEKK